jgi:hypothetical protein
MEAVLGGDEVVLTHDQAQRAASALVASHKKHEEASLLAVLTGGIGQVFTRAFAERDRAELEAGGEVVEGEVVREETDG